MHLGEKTILKKEQRPEIVVLSRNYSTGLGIIRALGSLGYVVDLVASVKKKNSSVIASSSRFVRNSYEVVFSSLQEDHGEGLISKLVEIGESEKKKILFPADDFTASVMDLNRDILSPLYIMPHAGNGKAGGMVRLMDKTMQANLAKEASLLVPEEWTISLREEIKVPEDIIYPCFVKPIESVSGYKTEMKRCEDKEELLLHLKEMKSFYSDRDVLVQEFLEIDKEYDFSGVCLDEKIIIPAVIEKTKIAEHEKGVTMAGKFTDPAELGSVIEKAKKMLKTFHYTGMFDMELNKCGEKILFNEVNLRPGGPNYSYFLNGVNLPEILVKELTFKDHEEKEEKVSGFGKSFVYEKVAWEEYINGCISSKERKKYIKEADFTLLNDKMDPKPGRVFEIKIRLSALKRKFLK